MAGFSGGGTSPQPLGALFLGFTTGTSVRSKELARQILILQLVSFF